MSETLSQKRCRFTQDVAKLIQMAASLGYDCALDQVKRTQAEANANAAAGRGISNSLHLDGLACDLNLYLNGKYLSSSSDHQQLGEWWESLGPDHHWGGRFSRPDGNHYSIGHMGRR